MTTQSEKSMDFNQEGVQMCIHSARTTINLIGWTARNVERLYAITPWWHTFHSLCEALSILMLELAYQAQHFPGEAAYILDDAKKVIRWLILMSEQSISARKAWEIFDSPRGCSQDKLERILAPGAALCRCGRFVPASWFNKADAYLKYPNGRFWQKHKACAALQVPHGNIGLSRVIMRR
ncbi:hypothetical protein DL98DRAFT_521193 [Cadophora sp. DSE1049]|nr:hypothetical protein DL98DRAFT_521193 [Cadophora sp. DSE1049]